MNYNDNNIEIAINSLEALKEERQLRIQAEEQLEAQKGKVLFADAVSVSKESILVGEMAVILKQSGVETGQERLFDWLRTNGYVYRQPCGTNIPTQRSLELGVMELKHMVLIDADGKASVKRTIKITPKGIQYFFDKVTADKDRINAIEAEKKAAKIKRDTEARRLKRQQQAV